MVRYSGVAGALSYCDINRRTLDSEGCAGRVQHVLHRSVRPIRFGSYDRPFVAR